MIVWSLILGFGSLLLLFPSKYFSAKYNFIGHQKEGEEGFVIEIPGWGQTSFFGNGEMKIKNRGKGLMFVILKKPVYFLSVFVKPNCLSCFQVIHLNITNYVIDDLEISKEEKTIRFLP